MMYNPNGATRTFVAPGENPGPCGGGLLLMLYVADPEYWMERATR
jgi:hypothetical protein